MASRQIKAKRATRGIELNEGARRAWLAGLGAVSIAQKRGERLVTTLVAEGSDFQLRSRKLATALVKDARRTATSVRKQIDGYVLPLRQRAKRAAKQIESGVSTRVGSVLARLGVPSKHDVQDLLSRIGDLSRQVKRAPAKRASARRKAA